MALSRSSSPPPWRDAAAGRTAKRSWTRPTRACRALAIAEDAAVELTPEESDAASIERYERELERLRKLEPPDEDRTRYHELLRGKEDGLSAWREFVRHRANNDHPAAEAALDRSRVSLVRAARIAGELRLDDCDSALF